MATSAIAPEQDQPVESPLARLRQVRDMLSRMDLLKVERDRLIRQAVELGHSERQIAGAAGISQGRINQIIHTDGGGR